MKLREIKPEPAVLSGEDYRKRKVARELYIDRVSQLVNGTKEINLTDEYAEYTIRVEDSYPTREAHIVVYNSDNDTFEVFEPRPDCVNYYEVSGGEIVAELTVPSYHMVHELFSRIEACGDAEQSI